MYTSLVTSTIEPSIVSNESNSHGSSTEPETHRKNEYEFEMFEDELEQVHPVEDKSSSEEEVSKEEADDLQELTNETSVERGSIEQVTEEESDEHLGGQGEAEVAITQSVIELDSEDDIENLEEMEELGEPKEPEETKEPPELSKSFDQEVLPEHEHSHIEADVSDARVPVEMVEEQPQVEIELEVAGKHYNFQPVEGADSDFDFSSEQSYYACDRVQSLSIERLFSLLRLDNDIERSVRVSQEKELVLSVSELKLSITEDNLYSREITLGDFITMFLRLRRNSHDPNKVPLTLTISISTRPRFISHFNKLSELIRSGQGLERISPQHLEHDHDGVQGNEPKRRRVGE